MMKGKAICAVVLSLMIAIGGVGEAQAAKDSGVGDRQCPSGFGRLAARQLGSGNSFAPGDYSHSPQWNPDSSSYRWIYDYQDGFSGGGGRWRIATNGDYLDLSVGCSPHGFSV